MAKKTKPSAPSAPALPGKLQGKSVFLAGNFYHLADRIKGLIELEGGTIVDELSDKTDIMVPGYTGAANAHKKAARLNAQGAGIQVIAQNQLGPLCQPTSDEAAQLLLSGPEGIERWNRLVDSMGGLGCFVQAGHSACIRGADFTKADLAQANLSILVEHTDFRGANLTGCTLNLAHCQLEDATLDGASVQELIDCTAPKVDFSRTAGDINIQSSDLSASCFANLADRYLTFVRCELAGADFSGVTTRGTPQFHECNLTKATFVDAKLEEADFARSDLSGANFTNANLKLAKFTGATVDGADFTGAAMVGADVAGVDFSRAKGFDSSQVAAKGAPGAAVKEFIKVAAQAQRVSTTLTVHQGSQSVNLTLDFYSQSVYGRDSTGNYYSGASQTTPAQIWFTMATKWHGATPDLTSVTVRATQASMTGKELKQLAIRAWCELLGIDAPSDEDLKKAAASTKAQKKEKADEWLGLLRTGKKGVEKWNSHAASLAKILDRASGVDLAQAKLEGIKLHNIEWKGANLSAADLAGAELLRCRFPEGNFAGANFKRSRLTSTSFNDANLDESDFSAANLAGSTFKRASCKKTKFAGTELNQADLCGADFTGADFAGAALKGASYDEKTVWPKGFAPTLEMIWKGPGTSPAAHKLVQSTKPRGKLDIEQFMKRLGELTDPAKLAKALAMLKADRFRLYAQVNDDHFVGVVKSQTDASLVYSCRLNADGTYACCTQNLNVCGGLRGSLCKHLLVLIVGLTQNAELDPNVIDTWIRLSKTNKPALDKDAMSETFLRYKGAEAGEIDWRPTETIPEDFYAM